MWAWNKCGGPEEDAELPTRFLFPETGCAFVIIPLPDGVPFRNALENLTRAAKYDLRAERCVGITLRRDGDYRLMEWMHFEEPWERNEEMDRLFSENYPFRPTRVEAVARYTFRAE